MDDRPPPPWIAFHGVTPSEFQKELRQRLDWVPIMAAWLQFFSELSAADRLQYKLDYPAPTAWDGIYDNPVLSAEEYREQRAELRAMERIYRSKTELDPMSALIKRMWQSTTLK